MPSAAAPAARASVALAASALWRRAQLTDRLFLGWFVGLGAVLAAAGAEGWPTLLALHLAAVAAVAALVATAARWPAVHAWYPLLVPIATFPEVARLNLMLAGAWQDAPLLAFEAWLFAEPPTVWLPRVTPVLLGELFRVGYLSYFVLLVVVAGRFWRRRDEPAFRGVIAASVLAYLACYVVFLAWPTEGPAHTLRALNPEPIVGGPMRELVQFVQRAGVHGNAFPSAHVAGALPPLVFAWREDWRFGLALLGLIVLMGLGAVHDGYHYASDVIAGAATGAAAAACVLAVQRRPAWARRVNLPTARTSGRSGTRA